MPNLAMRQPGSQFSKDGLDLSWPLGGEREIVDWPEEKMTLEIRRRIAEGNIVITNEKANTVPGEGERVYRLLTGDEARKHFDEPAGPVTRVVYHPATPEDERDYQLEVQSVQGTSERAEKAQEQAAERAEAEHAAISKRQIAAEKEAAKEAEKAKDDEEPDPIAERLNQSEEASADWYAEREKAFMERETERQKKEQEALKADAKVAAAKKDEADKNPEVTKIVVAETATPPRAKAPDKSEKADKAEAPKPAQPKVEAKAKETAPKGATERSASDST